MKNICLALLFYILFLSKAWTTPSGLTIQGKLVKDSTPVSGAVTVTITVTSPDTDRCILFQENHSLTVSAEDLGTFNISVGSGTRTSNDKGISLPVVFSNTGSAINSLNCLGSSATSYTPAATQSRHVFLSFNTPLGVVSFNDPYVVQSVPFALEANRLDGKPSSAFLQTTTETTQIKLNDLLDPAGQYTDLLSLLAGTSSKYMTTSNAGPTKLPVLSSPPAAPSVGQIWYESGVLKYYAGASGGGVKTLGTSDGSVTSVATGAGLTGGPITSTGTISLESGVATAGTYRSVTVDTYGRVTSGTNPTSIPDYGITDAVVKGGQSGAVSLGTADANSLSLNTNNTARVTILSDGKVGVGTATPIYNLDVGGGSIVSARFGEITITGAFSHSNLNGPGFRLGQTNGGTNNYITTPMNIGATAAPLSTLAVTGNLAVGSYAGVSAAPTQGLIVSGNVGFGTAAPNYPLEVNGSIVGTRSFATTGTAAAPGFSFIGDTGSGLFMNAPNSVGLSNGGTKVFAVWGSSLEMGMPIQGSSTRSARVVNTTTSLTVPVFTFRDATTLGIGADAADGKLSLITASTSRLAIDSAGNVGIGTTTPSYALDVNSGVVSSSKYRLNNGNDGVYNKFGWGRLDITGVSLGGNNPTSPNYIWPGSTGLTIGTSAASKSMLDVRGGITVGTGYATVNAAPTSGLIVEGNVGIGTTSPQTKLAVNGVISPSEDGNFSLGSSAYRFTDIYATGSVISTSDGRSKKNISDSDLGLSFIKNLRPVSYKFKEGDQSVHYGLIAQETELAVRKEKNKLGRIDDAVGIIVSYDKETNRYGLRYTELVAPIIKAIQELSGEESQLKDRIVGLERENAEMKERLVKLERAMNSK